MSLFFLTQQHMKKTGYKLHPLKYIGLFIKKNVVLWIALSAAVVTCFFVPVDSRYAEYFDLCTLGCLFCTLLVVGAFSNIRFFEYLSGQIVKKFKTLRSAGIALVFITYVGSMVLANDMALITFLPLGFFVLHYCGKEKNMAYVFILQNVAANLGGMLTPFGNPQNLYLYSFYGIPTGEFFAIMAIPFAVAFLLILLSCLLIPKEPLELKMPTPDKPKSWRAIVYVVLFAVSICTVFRLFPYYWGVLAVVLAMIPLDRKAFLRVDYPLLLTFCAFFVFAGNLSRIDAVKNLLGSAVSASPLLVGILSCQFISNVPSSVLLSHFTSDYANLLVAVNVGGLGTPIASLASLITLNQYRTCSDGKVGKYLALFLAVNFSFLAILTGVQLLSGAL